MFGIVHTLLATVLLCSLIALPIQIFGSDSVNPEILDRNVKEPYATYNSCGGVVKTVCDRTIVLEYKPDEDYDNNEFCVWVIRTDECQGALLTKTKSGFEIAYDYIQVAAFQFQWQIGDGPSYTGTMGKTNSTEQVVLVGPVNYVIFSTDNSNTGTGFRIEIVGFDTVGSPGWSDDFISTSPNGFTSLVPYHSSMRQSFVIMPKHTTVQSLQLDIDYYTVSTDVIVVFTLERNGQSINFRIQSSGLKGRGSASFQADYYANFVVLFYSYSSNPPADAGIIMSWAPSENVTTENYIASY